MELYDEEKRRRENRRDSKLNRIIIMLIIAVVILIIVLIGTIYYLTNNPNKITMNLNGKINSEMQRIVSLKENEDGTFSVYAPIKDFAGLVGYNSYNGEYLSSSQENDICHVINDNEVTTFYLDSNIIYKKDLTNRNSEYETYDIEEKVFEQDGVLYTSDKGLEKGFNVAISYNPSKKVLNISTLDMIVAEAKNTAINTFKQKGIDEFTLANQKAILDGYIIVTSEENTETLNTSQTQRFGVIDYKTGKEILEKKYEAITYVPAKSLFTVKINNKVGIIDENGQEKIGAQYDSLMLIDKDKELYLVQNNGLYGVIDGTGKTIIYLEFTQIGIETDKFKDNDIKSGYILLDKLIPVKQGNRWGFFDKEGNRITDLIYDNIGCTSGREGTSYNLLVIPKYNYIVVQRDQKYTFIDLNGNEILLNVLSSAYMRIISGEKVYYMVRDDIEYNIIQALEQRNRN